jgi:predicted AlkP superfamily phosphohydrolase/phosphomutase
VIAIAFDGAQPALVRRLMAAGEMPVLAGLAARGAWSRVTSSANIGSASVWPTFASGQEVLEHGMHYVWRWEPERMRVVREHGERIVPWWRTAAEAGRRVLTLDVPFLPLADVENCIEVADWGAHDRTRAALVTRPARLAAQIARDVDAHPYQRDPAPPHDDPSLRYLASASERARTGARLRGALAARLIAAQQPDLALVVFTEMHRASHLLWQTIAPDDPLYAGRRQGLDERALVDVFRAADDAVGQILDAAPPAARIALFSLHGMRPARGVPTLLHPLLVDLGYAAVPQGRGMSPRDAGRAAFAALKAGSPNWLRHAWRRVASPALLNAVAEPTAMRAYDWDRTRAFSLPSDQHGWVRINLAGREARGTVPAADYAGMCDELSAALLAARTEDGRPLVQRVLRLADGNGGRPLAQLPDLVVDWDDAAHDVPVRVRGSAVRSTPEGLRLTGKHAYEGFLIAAGLPPAGAVIASHELHRLITAS